MLKQVSHVVFVGLDDFDRLVPIGKMAFSKVYFVHGKTTSTTEDGSRQIIKHFQKKLGEMPSETIALDAYDMKGSFKEFLFHLKRIKKESTEVYINISSGTKIWAIAAMVAASVEDAKVYYTIPKEHTFINCLSTTKNILNSKGTSDKDKIGLMEKSMDIFKDHAFLSSGCKDIVELPSFPLLEPSEQEKKLLNFISTSESIDSIETVLATLKKDPVFKNYSSMDSLRNRISVLVNGLVSKRLLIKEKSMRNIHLELSPMGELVDIAYS